MRFDTEYDLVLEFDYPLGESSELAYDTWGRDIRAKVADRFKHALAIDHVRTVRQRNHLKVSARVHSYAVLAHALTLLLSTVMPQAPPDIVVKLHEVDKPDPTPDQTIAMEEIS